MILNMTCQNFSDNYSQQSWKCTNLRVKTELKTELRSGEGQQVTHYSTQSYDTRNNCGGHRLE